MYFYDFLTLLTAAFAGSLIGSFLLLTMIVKPLISKQLNHSQWLFVYRRFYRLNMVLSLLGGLLAALLKYQQAAFVLAILAASYVFANMHILKGFLSHFQTPSAEQNTRSLGLLKLAQNGLHFFQFLAAAWVIYYLK
ncbi:MAG: hypothetical protein OEY43_08200 [Gammaproteobacteria bacterium]|nr:hypothetical protein [Gammaproteobacteria bacterium]